MTECIEITPQQAWEMLQHDDAAVLADVRDPQTFSYAYPKGAFNLTEATWPHFEALYDYDQPIILSCYHGISSRNVAAFLLRNGYEKVYSLQGGFAAWEKANLPLETGYALNPTETM